MLFTSMSTDYSNSKDISLDIIEYIIKSYWFDLIEVRRGSLPSV